MTGRDRMVIIAVAAVLVLVAAWFVVVAPEREKAASLNAKVAAASAQLATADSQAAAARTAQAQYQAAYASIVSIGKAVPPSQEVPSLIYQLAQASRQRNVKFAAITSGGSGSSSPSSSASPSSNASPSSATVSGFTPMPFTFTFNGSFFDLYSLFRQLDRATVITTSGQIVVSGRLLTIQSVKLAPQSTPSGAATASSASSEQLSGTITATAYVLPASQGLTGGATPGAPAGAGQGATTPASSSGSQGSPTAPAIARVTP